MVTFVAGAGDGDFSNAEPGMQRATLQMWADLGTQPSNNPEYEPKRRFYLVWELDQLRDDGKPFTAAMWINHSPSFHEKSKIRQMAESWRGKPYQKGEAFDPSKAIGRSAMLNVTINDRGYPDIISVNPLPKSMQPLPLVSEATYWDMDQPDWAAWERIPEYMQEKVEISPEYKELRGGKSKSAPPPMPSAGHAERREAVLAEAAATPDFDDDLPF